MGENPDAAPDPTSRERVLLVDDDPPLLRMLERTLAAEGFEITAAADGAAALVATERSAPDVIVLDVAMPGLDGLAVCRRLRAKGLATPILMLTARDAVSDRVAGLEAGADDYLVKPFATAGAGRTDPGADPAPRRDPAAALLCGPGPRCADALAGAGGPVDRTHRPGGGPARAAAAIAGAHGHA